MNSMMLFNAVLTSDPDSIVNGGVMMTLLSEI